MMSDFLSLAKRRYFPIKDENVSISCINYNILIVLNYESVVSIFHIFYIPYNRSS